MYREAGMSKKDKLIQAMKQNTSLPVSIKIRVDGRSGETNNIELAKAFSSQKVADEYIKLYNLFL